MHHNFVCDSLPIESHSCSFLFRSAHGYGSQDCAATCSTLNNIKPNQRRHQHTHSHTHSASMRVRCAMMYGAASFDNLVRDIFIAPECAYLMNEQMDLFYGKYAMPRYTHTHTRTGRQKRTVSDARLYCFCVMWPALITIGKFE